MESSIFLPVLIVILLAGLGGTFYYFYKVKRKPKRVCSYCGMELEDFMETCIYCDGDPNAATAGKNTSIETYSNNFDELTPVKLDFNDTAPPTKSSLVPKEMVNTNVLSDDEKARKDNTPQKVIDDLSEFLLNDSDDDEKILKQLQRTTILKRIPSLEIIKGRRKVKKVKLGKELFYFGKELGCDVVIDDSSIMNRHAVIKNQGDYYILFSLAEPKVIEVNGKKVAKKGLQNGDVIRISNYSFVFRIDDKI